MNVLQVEKYVADGYLTIKVPIDNLLRGVLTTAIAVCNARYSDAEWDALSNAIGQLVDALQLLGVKFNNPRIDK